MSPPCDECHETKDLTNASPAYRRALQLVAALNLGMGLLEMSGGFFGLSNALKADALDFIGDGFITLLALVAISRGPRWRARAALLQGIFLAALAVGVVGAAIYRVVETRTPEAEVMGLLGFLALGTNVAAALVLLRHREGDASVRAVWLFSRNDALGNVVVIAAGALVHWFASGWPDIVAALLIAGLFLTSAKEIIRSARKELLTLGRASTP